MARFKKAPPKDFKGPRTPHGKLAPRSKETRNTPSSVKAPAVVKSSMKLTTSNTSVARGRTPRLLMNAGRGPKSPSMPRIPSPGPKQSSRMKRRMS